MKKRARSSPDHRIIFQLILPYVFPGAYKSYVVAFKSFLALAGVCAQLRYWNLLRRWIGYLCPADLRSKMKDHSFPVFLGFTGLEEFQEKANRILCRDKIIGIFSPATFASFWVLNGFFQNNQSLEMDYTLGSVPLFNIAQCDIEGQGKILIHHADTFSEFALFCYVASTCEIPEDVIGFLAVVSWKTEKYDSIYIEAADRERFAQRTLVGRMKRIGMTAPQEIGFHQGQLPCTSFSWFIQHCDTNGNRKKIAPLQRLSHWAQTWFPMTNRLWSEQDQNDAPYEFHLQPAP